jgi:hypothetical protein
MAVASVSYEFPETSIAAVFCSDLFDVGSTIRREQREHLAPVQLDKQNLLEYPPRCLPKDVLGPALNYLVVLVPSTE